MRHAHEWQIFKAHPLPEGKLIIRGVIDSLTNVVEHHELVAERIGRYAEIVGKERVIAGTDCGFSTGVARPAARASHRCLGQAAGASRGCPTGDAAAVGYRINSLIFYH